MDRRLLIFLALFGGIVCALVIGIAIGEGGFILPGLLIAGGLFVFLLAIANWQPVPLCFFFLGLGGALPMASNLTPFTLAVLICFAWFTVEYICFKRGPVNWPKGTLALLITIICLILAFNLFRGGGGFRAFGSEQWGAKRYLDVAVAVFFSLIILSWKVDMRDLNRIPLFILVAAGIDFCIWLIQYLLPSSINAIYPIYATMISGLSEDVLNPSTGVERLYGFRTLGLGVVLYCASTHDFKVPLSGKSLLYGGILIPLGICLTALAGFRTYVTVALFMAFLAAILRMKWQAAIPTVLGAFMLGMVILGQGNFYELPIQAQRALSFLPGDWESSAVGDAMHSTQWRQNIWRVWYNKYFPQHPFLGRGWSYDPREALGASLTGFLKLTQDELSYTFATTGDLHNGPLSAIDAVGTIGMILLLILSVGVLRFTWKSANKIGFLNLQPIQRWTVIYLTSWLLIFWILDGFFQRFWPPFIVYCALSIRVFSEKYSVSSDTAPSPRQRETPTRRLARARR